MVEVACQQSKSNCRCGRKLVKVWRWPKSSTRRKTGQLEEFVPVEIRTERGLLQVFSHQSLHPDVAHYSEWTGSPNIVASRLVLLHALTFSISLLYVFHRCFPSNLIPISFRSYLSFDLVCSVTLLSICLRFGLKNLKWSFTPSPSDHSWAFTNISRKPSISI